MYSNQRAHTLNMDHITTADGNSYTITFSSYKHSKSATPALVLQKHINVQHCPVTALRNYILLRGRAPGPIFIDKTGNPVTRDGFAEHLKICLQLAGLPFGKLLNEENPRTVFGDGVPNEGLTPAINRKEVEVALKEMKLGKAMGPDGIPVEVWKSLGEEGVDMLLDLLQKIFEQEKMPEEWRDSVIVPIFKEKGDIQDCGNYRGIKMISHTMTIWERVIDRRLREETTIGEEQFGFMPGRGTTDAIFAAIAGDRETPGNAERTAPGVHRP